MVDFQVEENFRIIQSSRQKITFGMYIKSPCNCSVYNPTGSNNYVSMTYSKSTPFSKNYDFRGKEDDN